MCVYTSGIYISSLIYCTNYGGGITYIESVVCVCVCVWRVYTTRVFIFIYLFFIVCYASRDVRFARHAAVPFDRRRSLLI